MRKIVLAGAIAAATVLAGAANPAFADPIEGMWKNSDGVLLKVSSCAGQFCVDVMDGKYKGKRSGQLKAVGGGVYEGTLTKFSLGVLGNNIKGRGVLNGNTLAMSGTKMGITQEDVWQRQ